VKQFLATLSQDLPLLFTKKTKTPRLYRHVPFRGKDMPLTLVLSPETLVSEIEQDESGLRLRRGLDNLPPQHVLREWLVDRAREAFVERAAYWAPRLEVRYSRITIRDQRTVWGSCTRDGKLAFNFRVIMAPPEVLDYLVIHELSHLREMNHSKKFWAIVAEHCPGWRAHRQWLRDHSRRLKGAIRRAS
jgi:predicted metal-dependent hydrolase